MALVANYGSDEEDDYSSEEEEPKPSSSTKIAAVTPVVKAVPIPITPKNGPVPVISSDSEDETNDLPTSLGEDEGKLGKFLPKPKGINIPIESEEEIGPIPPKKVYGDEEVKPPTPPTFHNIKSKKVQGIVRIAAPSLKDFENDDDDDSPSTRRLINPSKKGSGLFSILPEPKGGFLRETRDSTKPVSFLKSKPDEPSSTSSSISSSSTSVGKPSSSSSLMPRSLIPDSVKLNLSGKRPAPSKIEEIRAKYLKQDANVRIVSRSTKKAVDNGPSTSKDSDDSDEDGETDFFSFDSKANEVDEETLEKLKLPAPDFSQFKPATSSVNEDLDDEGSNEATPSTSSTNNDVMKYVQKKKGKGAGEINIIDLNADDLRPDSTEWIKNMTDQSAVPPRRGKGLGGMQKRKHQITYLAFEAKAREQELQAQWANQRNNKRQTNMKYGF